MSSEDVQRVRMVPVQQYTFFTADPEVTVAFLAELIRRLGGAVTITQAQVDLNVGCRLTPSFDEAGNVLSIKFTPPPTMEKPQ
jgi:hypothetical protein